MREIDRDEIWFRPMMNVVALRLLEQVAWGSKLRLYMGASLSMLDMASDVYMILLYWNTLGLERAGVILLNFLLANVAWQLLLVIAQNKKAPWRVLLREILYVLTCTKVGVDVYRVASGAKREVYQLFPADAELGE